MSEQATSNSTEWCDLIRDIKENVSDGRGRLALAAEHPNVKPRFVSFIDQLAYEFECIQQLRVLTAWAKVTLATDDSKTRLLNCLREEGFHISHKAEGIIHQEAFRISTERTTIGLYRRRVDDLGFRSGARFDEILARLDQAGFCTCPNETPLQLRRHYKEQPKNEWLTVISEPIVGPDGEPSILTVANNSNGLSVYGRYARPDSLFLPEQQLVFCLK